MFSFEASRTAMGSTQHLIQGVARIMSPGLCVCMYVCVCVCGCLCLWVCVCVWVCVCMCVCVCGVCVCVCFKLYYRRSLWNVTFGSSLETNIWKTERLMVGICVYYGSFTTAIPGNWICSWKKIIYIFRKMYASLATGVWGWPLPPISNAEFLERVKLYLYSL